MNIAEIYETKSGRFKWRLRSISGQIFAVSPGSFPTYDLAHSAIIITSGAFGAYNIIDRT